MTKLEDLVGCVVLKVKTTKMICCSCKKSFVIPKGCEGETGECENCGNTSFEMHEGRPWGHNHRYWKDWICSAWELSDKNQLTEKSLYNLHELSDAAEFLVLSNS
jgi:hypothetical protein